MRITVELGAGKIDPTFIEKIHKNPNHIYIVVDRCYEVSANIKSIEKEIHSRIGLNCSNGIFIFCNEDIFSFMEKMSFKVDEIIANRILEHIPTKDLLYFLFLLHSSIKPEGKFSFIVPNHLYYAKEIIYLDIVINRDDIRAKEVYNKLLNITTEFCNEPSDPHMSIWTPEFAKFYLELEGYWKIEKCEEIKMGDRPYLSIIAFPIKL